MQKGDKFERDFKVTETVYNSFIQAFNDRNPLHTDEQFAKEKGFAGKVMHGNILNGFVSYFVGECLPDKNVMIQTQEIKYSLPVYLDDVVHFYAEVDDVYESVNTIEFKFYFKNSEGKKVAKGRVQIGLLL
jgi:3-hydroxybutyryl-CoA dehydratase